MKAPVNTLSVWYLADPQNPVKVGTAHLSMGGRGVDFTYDQKWIDTGFPLSGDMPLQAKPIVQGARDLMLGALSDAMPDRWGERAIRYLDKPRRTAFLDFLYLAGDRRFGALGFSANPNKYEPYGQGPLPSVESMEALVDLVHRIELNDRDSPDLTDAEKLISSTTRTMGGAHPKALMSIDGEEYIVKFPRGGHVDLPLIEHASLQLAEAAGIEASTSIAIQTYTGHVVAIKRFDRRNEYGWQERLHTLSAKTVIMSGVGPVPNPSNDLSYGAMADFLRLHGHPDHQLAERHQLFRRMALNIMIDNTDDHEKNHAFIMDDDHYWRLAPAYDVLPLMSGLGHQQMGVGVHGSEGTLENALSDCERFGLSKKEALQVWHEVASVVKEWKAIFAKAGVTENDIRELEEFIDTKSDDIRHAEQPGNRLAV